MESINRVLNCHLLLECKQPGSHGFCTLATFSSFTRQRWSRLKLRKRQVRASLSVDRAAVREEAIERPVAASCLSKKAIGNKPECTSCQAKGLVLCTTCSGSGLYVDSILESQGIIVKVRCLGCGGTGSVMCPDCGGNGCI